MPRHDGNTHRGPSHRRRHGHRMKSGGPRKLSRLKKLTRLQRRIKAAPPPGGGDERATAEPTQNQTAEAQAQPAA